MKSTLQNLRKPLLIVGIGNIMKGDDAVGPVLVENMLARNKKTASLNCGDVPENYIKKIVSSGAKTVIFADAAETGKKPGSFELFASDKIEETGVSTHGISLALIADTIKQESGAEVVLLGIQPKSMKLGESLSPEVEKAIEEILTLIE